MGFEGREVSGEEPEVDYQRATPGYFETMGIPLRRGRLFTDADRDGAPGVVIVSETAARRFWPGDDPVGRHVFLGSRDPLTVIGIVGDVRGRTLARAAVPEVYRPWLQSPDALVYVARTSNNSLIGRLSAPGATLDGDRVAEVKSLRDHVMGSLQETAGRVRLFVVLAVTIVLLAIVGVSGLTAHVVVRRTQEIGIRLALGASPYRIVRLLIAHTAVAGTVGIVGGWAAAWWATGFFEHLLFEVPPRDPLTFASGTVLLMGAILTAAWLPARHAARLDPASTLRAN
jgi:hypothetical protein